MREKRYIHTTVLPIRWGDMDAMAHVNNTEYFRYMEQTRVEWLSTLDYSVKFNQTEGPVIVNASCTFRKPLTYPGTVEVRMYIGQMGRSSLPTYYEIRLSGQAEVYAEGAATMVWIATATNKSVSIPQKIKAILESDDC